MNGAVYVQGHVVEPTSSEATLLLALFPAHFTLES